MRVRKTSEHGGATLAHGRFRVRETEHICEAGCTEQPIGAVKPRPLVRRQSSVAEVLPPRATFGYDVMVFVGLQRFVHYRDRNEIRQDLTERYGITLSTGEVSTLAHRFLVYLEALHKDCAPQLRRALDADGGWPLHIDATGEDGRGTLFVAYAGWRGWALGAWKIPTERADAMLPRLRAIEDLFGPPCAVIRDLGRAVTEAARGLVEGRPIPILGCHLHFLKDIGKDLLHESHGQMHDLFRRFEVCSRLRALVRELGRSIGADMVRARRDVGAWLDGADPEFLVPAGIAGLATVRALAQWVLDYHNDGTDAGFPFDRPMLDLHQRCLRAARAAESLLRKPSRDEPSHQALDRLHRIMVVVRSEVPFRHCADIIRARSRLFDELRDALRLRPRPPADAPVSQTNTSRQRNEIRDIEREVNALRTSLRERRPERGPAQDTRHAIDLMLKHLDDHGTSLWGHVITLPAHAGGGLRLVERTNILLESFFHEIKHGECRRSGRKVLTQDFEQLPAAAVLARNLTRPDYVTIVCGSLENLHLAFAQLDAADRSLSLPARLRATASDATDGDTVSASLPKVDRDIVRNDTMRHLVLTEASRRAPLRSAC